MNTKFGILMFRFIQCISYHLDGLRKTRNDARIAK